MRTEKNDSVNDPPPLLMTVPFLIHLQNMYICGYNVKVECQETIGGGHCLQNTTSGVRLDCTFKKYLKSKTQQSPASLKPVET